MSWVGRAAVIDLQVPVVDGRADSCGRERSCPIPAAADLEEGVGSLVGNACMPRS